MTDQILKILIIAFSIILLIIVFYKLNFQKNSYEEISKGLIENYDLNISNILLEKESSYIGTYDSNSQITKITDDEEITIEIQDNLYEKMLEYLPSKAYKEEEIERVVINFDDFNTKNLLWNDIINVDSTMNCDFEIFNNRMNSISCQNDDEILIIDFYFDN